MYVSYSKLSKELKNGIGILVGPAPGGGGHSHMEMMGMCGHDPKSRGLLVTD